MQAFLYTDLTSRAQYGADISYEKKPALWEKKYSVIGRVCVIALLFFILNYKLKPGLGTRVITSRYPVPETGNAAHHENLDIQYKNDI